MSFFNAKIIVYGQILLSILFDITLIILISQKYVKIRKKCKLYFFAQINADFFLDSQKQPTILSFMGF
jgi:hypothetical protein